MFDSRIYTFLEVADTLNFTKAAEQLCITQPAVSKHIQYLEGYFKVALFSHQGKKISLTKEGEYLKKALNTMICDEKLLKKQMIEEKNIRKSISFGVTLTIGEFAMGACVSDYRKKHPNENISMQVNNTKILLEELEQGTIEFAFIEGGIERDKFSCELFSTEEFVGVCASDYEFLNTVHTIQDLTKEAIFLREVGSGSREIFMQALKERDIPLETFENITEMGSIHLIKQMLCKGEGISFLYRIAVEKELNERQLKVLPLLDFKLFHDFTFVWRKNSIYEDKYRKILSEFKHSYHISRDTEFL